MAGKAPLSILWLIDLQPHFGIRHGATLRWLNFSRELVALGHRVCLSVNQDDAQDVEAKRLLLEEYRHKGWLSAQAETHYRFPTARGRRAHLLGHPSLTNRSLRSFQDETVARVKSLIAEQSVDVVIVSQRKLLFLVPRLRGVVPVIVDWMDSLVLHEWRAARAHQKRGAMPAVSGSIKRMAQAALQERYYGRRAGANLAVSPVDLRILNRMSGRPDLGRLLLNGVEGPRTLARAAKEPSRLIFTGAMDAPPNYEAALWYIDQVMPIVGRERPDLEFVVAGRDPNAELVRRAGPRVRILGEVADLRGEIARSALFVAPLRSGCGFKNKIVESLAAGTFVAGTRMAVEFLPVAVRRQLLADDSPEGLARHILTFLKNPVPFERRLPTLMRIVARDFSWQNRTGDLLRIVSDTMKPASNAIAA